MTRIVLEIDRQQDLDLLLALLRRLHIRVIEPSADSEQPSPADEIRALILKGLPAHEDFENFVRDFEEGRQDRPLPGREG